MREFHQCLSGMKASSHPSPLHWCLCKHCQSLLSFLSSSASYECEGAKSFREVLGKPTRHLSRAPFGRKRRLDQRGFEESIRVSPKAVWKFPLESDKWRSRSNGRWTTSSPGRGVFTLSVVSLSGPVLCQEGLQRAQLSIQAKNTCPHALWNTLPLFTCVLTLPDLFTGLSQ